MSLKWCNKCKQDLPLSEFYTRKKYGTLQGPCKKCRDKKGKEWCLNNYERFKFLLRRSSWRKRGVDPEEALKTISEANCCKLCGSREKLYVDHGHVTKQIRGVLCNHCNLGLGHFKDNPSTLRKAADYLEKRSVHQ